MNIKEFALLVLIIVMLSLFCFYLTPNRRPTPTRTQSIAAKSWLIVRRLVSYTGGLFFALIALLLLIDAPESNNPIMNIGYFLLFSAFSWFVINFGVFGKKNKYSNPAEDIAAHEKRKRYYKWK